uniref:Uncharacterized protein n=1 Tax=Leersia perrieri TaxID=77586 RepID=A0A0D9VMD0_9ORYZ
MGSLDGDAAAATSPSFSSTGSSGDGGGGARVGIYACFANGDGSNTLECYEPGANTWRRVGEVPGVPAGHVLKGFGIVSLGDFVYVIGGRLCRGGGGDDTDVAVRGDVARTLRYKCAGVTWHGRFHVIGGFASAAAAAGEASSALERSSAEVFDCGRGEWEIIPGMWQLDVPPNQIVAVDGRLFSSGDCLNSWKGHVEVYDGELNIWTIVDHSAATPDIAAAVLPPSAQRRYCTMAVVGTRLYFLAGYQVAGDGDGGGFRTVSLVHSFDTSATPELMPAWSSFQPIMDQEDMDDGIKELFSQCCSLQL